MGSYSLNYLSFPAPIRRGPNNGCGEQAVLESRRPGPQAQKGRRLYLTSDEGGVERSGFWKMGWGKGQDSRGSLTSNPHSDLYGLTFRVGSLLGCDGKVWRSVTAREGVAGTGAILCCKFSNHESAPPAWQGATATPLGMCRHETLHKPASLSHLRIIQKKRHD